MWEDCSIWEKEADTVFLRWFGSLSEWKNTPTKTPMKHLDRAASYFIAKLVDRALGSW